MGEKKFFIANRFKMVVSGILLNIAINVVFLYLGLKIFRRKGGGGKGEFTIKPEQNLKGLVKIPDFVRDDFYELANFQHALNGQLSFLYNVLRKFNLKLFVKQSIV